MGSTLSRSHALSRSSQHARDGPDAWRDLSSISFRSSRERSQSGVPAIAAASSTTGPSTTEILLCRYRREWRKSESMGGQAKANGGVERVQGEAGRVGLVRVGYYGLWRDVVGPCMVLGQYDDTASHTCQLMTRHVNLYVGSSRHMTRGDWT